MCIIILQIQKKGWNQSKTILKQNNFIKNNWKFKHLFLDQIIQSPFQHKYKLLIVKEKTKILWNQSKYMIAFIILNFIKQKINI